MFFREELVDDTKWLEMALRMSWAAVCFGNPFLWKRWKSVKRVGDEQKKGHIYSHGTLLTRSSRCDAETKAEKDSAQQLDGRQSSRRQLTRWNYSLDGLSPGRRALAPAVTGQREARPVLIRGSI